MKINFEPRGGLHPGIFKELEEEDDEWQDYFIQFNLRVRKSINTPYLT